MLSVCFAALVLTVLFSPQAATANCGSVFVSNGSCTVSGSTGDNQVNLGVKIAQQIAAAAQAESQGATTQAISAAELANLRWWAAQWERLFAEPTCASYGTCQSAEITSTVIAEATEITLEDIASFIPATPGSVSEPGEWTLVGVPTNFILSAEQHIVDGTLLGLPAQVRFTPVAGHWRHSDGGSVDAGTLGASWAALGVPELTPTATSYVYRASGSYIINSFVEYSAEYQVNGGAWIGVDGTVTADAPPLTLRAFQGSTALVNRTCAEAPSAAGC